MGGIGWRAGALGAVSGAVATWLVAPWVSMVVHGTVAERHDAWLRRQGVGPENPTDTTAPAAAARGSAMPRAWDTIPGTRPHLRARAARTRTASSAPRTP